MRVTAYSLRVNGRKVAEIAVETPAWLPVKPKINKDFVKGLVRQAMEKAGRVSKCAPARRNGVTAETCTRMG